MQQDVKIVVRVIFMTAMFISILMMFACHEVKHDNPSDGVDAVVDATAPVTGETPAVDANNGNDTLEDTPGILPMTTT